MKRDWSIILILGLFWFGYFIGYRAGQKERTQFYEGLLKAFNIQKDAP